MHPRAAHVADVLTRRDVPGHPHTVFPTSFAELVRITGGTPADVAEPAG